MKPNRIVMKVYGKYALFTDPMTKIGGEKSSMMIPSYETLKGIVCGNYWKPSIDWIIESVKVLNPIRTERKGIRPIKYNGGNDLSYYTYLSDVAYIISAHFEFNKRRPDLQEDWNEDKHYFLAKRALEKGGRRDQVPPSDLQAEPRGEGSDVCETRQHGRPVGREGGGQEQQCGDSRQES